MRTAVSSDLTTVLSEPTLTRRRAPALAHFPSLQPVSVLHIDTERGWRGGERQVLWLADSLVKKGNRCVIAARPGQPLAERAAERGLRVFPCQPRWEFDPVAALTLARFIRREGIEIVHAHTAHAASIALLCARDAKTVITRRVDFRVSRYWISQLKYRRATAIIAISKAVADSLVASGIDARQIEIIPSGVDLTRAIPRCDNDALRSLGVPDGAPLVVMVAALAQHKDPLTFLEAMKSVLVRVPTAHALLIGDGPLRSTVERAAVRLGLSGNVHIAGYRCDAESLMAAADVIALSSTKEGLGTVLIDALWMGKAVAATTAGGIPEIVEHGSCGLLSAPGDPAALGDGIYRLLDDGALRARLGSAGRRRAAAFSVERTAIRTAQVYQSVAANGA